MLGEDTQMTSNAITDFNEYKKHNPADGWNTEKQAPFFYNLQKKQQSDR